VRAQAGIEETRFEPSHLVAGLLVDCVAGWARDATCLGTEDDRMFYIFPQGETRARLYNCTSLDQTDRFAGEAGLRRFMEGFNLRSVPGSEELAAGTPIGPCATLTGEDTVVERPYAAGVVLIGDAAGYNDPIMGQGLSLAMRDVRLVSELMAAGSASSSETWRPYAEERVERMRRMRFAAALMAELKSRFGEEARQRRARYLAKVRAGDQELLMAPTIAGMGPDRVNSAWYTESVWERALK
jgi:2-polyprenyl-6-methoxyphenol hydroxylase-like FAD-dependent oxidoreductase